MTATERAERTKRKPPRKGGREEGETMYQMYATHTKIRSRMVEMGVDRSWMCKKLDMSPSTFSAKMNAKSDLSLREAYTILDILHIPRNQIYVYFPLNGKADDPIWEEATA